jgi:hypothetical protein
MVPEESEAPKHKVKTGLPEKTDRPVIGKYYLFGGFEEVEVYL